MMDKLRRVKRSGGQVCYLLSDRQYTRIEKAWYGSRRKGTPPIGETTELGYSSRRPAGNQICGAHARKWAQWSQKSRGGR